jgi:hypothetical protein
MKTAKLVLILSVLLFGCSKDKEEQVIDPNIASLIVGKYILASITTKTATTNFPHADGRRGEYIVDRIDDSHVKIVVTYYLANNQPFGAVTRQASLIKDGNTVTAKPADTSVITFLEGLLTDTGNDAEGFKVVATAKKQ